jgi:predicted transcriptional regulator YheO
MPENRKKDPLVKSLIPIVKAISATFGKNCEVVLHDFSGLQHSIILIENGHVTGRKVGDPITDFALASLKEGGFGDG